MSRAGDLAILNDELTNDPLTRGYAGMTDAQAAADLNTEYRTTTVATVTGSQILNATDDTEYSALTDTNKDRWLALCAVDEIETTSGIAKALEAEIFGGGTTTRSNLQAIKNPPISRAAELGVRDLPVTEKDVADARAG